MTDEQIKEKEGVASLLINQQGRRPLCVLKSCLLAFASILVPSTNTASEVMRPFLRRSKVDSAMSSFPDMKWVCASVRLRGCGMSLL